ncbi:MAG: hypothetical protein FJW39_34885 [Acidobacteria bacterium]|nr:hypothetical protein [Acidobacteriota bacterium]
MKTLDFAPILLAAGIALAAERFDHVVRNDFFLGFAGNQEALARGMKTCEKILAEDPNHSEALVWHGSGLWGQAGAAFQRGDREAGMELSQKGLAEMDKAVALAPDNIGVRIPRGASLLAGARAMRDSPFRRSLFERALSDHQRAYELQKEHIDGLGDHPKGELLFALADTNPSSSPEGVRRRQAL